MNRKKKQEQKTESWLRNIHFLHPKNTTGITTTRLGKIAILFHSITITNGRGWTVCRTDGLRHSASRCARKSERSWFAVTVLKIIELSRQKRNTAHSESPTTEFQEDAKSGISYPNTKTCQKGHVVYVGNRQQRCQPVGSVRTVMTVLGTMHFSCK